MATIRCAVLLLFATSVAAAPDLSPELLTVRTVKVCSSGDKASQDQAAELRQKIDEVIPSLIPDTSDEADLLIEFEESLISSDDGPSKRWRATLYHLACQRRELGEPPGRIVRGRCENNLFVRVGMGKMYGQVAMDRSATEDFAHVLRDAILGCAPVPAAPAPEPPVAVPELRPPDIVIEDPPVEDDDSDEQLTSEPSPPPQTEP